MKKIFFIIGLFYFIPFTGNGQFREKNGSSSSGNSSSNNNTRNSNTANKNKPKPIDITKSKFNGDYEAPQAFTANFEDGSTIDYVLAHRNPDEIARFSLFFPANFNYAVSGAYTGFFGIDLIGASYYQPNVFNVQIEAGFTPVDWDLSGLLFFKKWNKMGKQRIVLNSSRSGNVQTNFVAYQTMPKKRLLGLHVGYGERTFGTITQQSEFNYTYMGGTSTGVGTINNSYTYNATQITLGLGLMNIEHYSIFTSVQNKTKTNTHVGAVYLDALLYPSATANNYTTTYSENQGYTPSYNYFPEATLKPKLLQGRLYYEARNAHTNGTYEWGWVSKIGVATNPSGNLYFFADYGLYFTI